MGLRAQPCKPQGTPPLSSYPPALRAGQLATRFRRMSDTPEFTWITTAAELASLGKRMQAAPWVAIDTESNSRFVYRERVCLLQVNIEDELFLVDTLTLPAEPATLAALKPALENPAQRLYLHGGEYDVACCKRDYDLELRGIFDTQQAASFLGIARTGYGALVEEFCEVKLPKEHGLYDWATRPIDPDALRYALDDVHYLPMIAARLEEAVREADIEEELAIANAGVEDVRAHQNDFDPAAMYRIKGIGQLHQSKLGVMTALYAWRDALAAELDQPPGRIIHNEALLGLARNAPTNFNGLRKARLPGRVLREHGEALITVIKQATESPPAIPEPPARREVDPRERGREQALKRWRRTEAEKRKLPLQVVLPARALEYFKKHGADDFDVVPHFGPKRAEHYGEAIRKVLASKK